VRHALRNALIPTVTVLGLAYGNLLSGAVMTETIFAWPGLGRYAFEAAISNDFPSIMGVTFVIALMYVVANLAVDLCYGGLDPARRDASPWPARLGPPGGGPGNGTPGNAGPGRCLADHPRPGAPPAVGPRQAHQQPGAHVPQALRKPMMLGGIGVVLFW